VTTRLILLANDFPHPSGDASFIRNEIGTLAERFDEVVVFNYARDPSADHVHLDSNVVYGGNLFGRARLRTLRALFSGHALATAMRAMMAERRSGALRGNVKTFIMASLVGMRVAADPTLRNAIAERGTCNTIYAFWGMGAALSLPWLPPVSGQIAVRLHRYDLYEERSRYLPFRRSLFSTADLLLPVSNDGESYLLRRYPDARLEQKVVVSRLGTSGAVAVQRAERTAVRTIVSCSSLISVKRVHRILDALRLIHGGEQLRWIHFGGGPLERALRDRVTSAKIDGIDVDIRGATPHDEIMRFYADNRVDVFINVSVSEGVPVSVMEAMSFDIPIIATSVGGTPEIVSRELGSGELIGKDFADSDLAVLIGRVLDGPDERYRSRFVWEQLCDARVNSESLARALLAATPGQLPS
jgi:glycosyltransferase involved in cell wall biosynthesis